MSRLPSIWSSMNMPCREISRLASESLDRDLGRLERFALKSHLFYCIACRRYLRQLLFLRRALRELGSRLESEPPTSGPELPEHVRERIKRALEGG
jgi:hypothetical protein